MTKTKYKVDVESRVEKNHGKKVKYRIRVQQDRESQQELKEYKRYKDANAHES